MIPIPSFETSAERDENDAVKHRDHPPATSISNVGIRVSTFNHETFGRVLVQPLEPMLLPKLRIDFADFPWSHCSIDQRLFTSESGCGYRYGPLIRESL